MICVDSIQSVESFKNKNQEEKKQQQPTKTGFPEKSNSVSRLKSS